jgi:hypothetical protein
MFPHKKIYFKLDTDTIIFPKRLMTFFHTLNAVVDDTKPVYFGTVVESGMGMLLCGRDWANKGNVAKGMPFMSHPFYVLPVANFVLCFIVQRSNYLHTVVSSSSLILKHFTILHKYSLSYLS